MDGIGMIGMAFFGKLYYETLAPKDADAKIIMNI